MIKSKSNSTVLEGYISGVNGSLIHIKGIENSIKLHDLIKISNHNILGEVIQIYSDYVIAQCFENTTNLRIHDRIEGLNEALSMELAPGLLGNIFVGIQRPLQEAVEIFKDGGLKRGLEIPSLS